MYKGSNKSALLSQKLISEALLRLLETMPFNDISVSSDYDIFGRAKV